MAQASEQLEYHVPPPGQAQALPAAVGLHVGLGMVCASAVYTEWQRALVTLPQWGAMLVVAVALLYGALAGGPAMARRTWLRGLLALAGLLVFRLAYEPQLGSLVPRLGEELPRELLAANPGLAFVGVIIAFISWLAYRGAGGELELGVIPFRRSAAAATGLLVLTAAFCFAMLHGPHDLSPSDAWRPALVALQGGALVVVLLSVGGGPSVRKAPHLYLALTLVAAFVRNMGGGGA